MFHSVPLPKKKNEDYAGNPRLAMQAIFGHKDYRGVQERSVEAALAGRDVFVGAPTGQGKSLCFQLPALASRGLCVVVSPLVALMKDQVDGLRRRGVAAAALVGSDQMDVRERIEVESAAYAGDLSLLYVSPERLRSERFRTMLAELPISLFAVDEAHCVCEWGHDFRADYLLIPEALDLRPEVPRMVLTASASIPMRKEIVGSLLRDDALVLAGGADRGNLDIEVVLRGDLDVQLRDLLHSRASAGAAIVYCRSRAQTEEVAAMLAASGLVVDAYHAGMEAAKRIQVQDGFIAGRLQAVVATSAFGMGIDKPDIATVAHVALPETLEEYYQQIGRAGRDGRQSVAWLAWAPKDVGRSHRVEGEDSTVTLRRAARLETVMGFIEAPTCRRNALMGHFGDHFDQGCGRCDLCLAQRDVMDGTEQVAAALGLVDAYEGVSGVSAFAEALAGILSERVVASGMDVAEQFGKLQQAALSDSRRLLRQCIGLGLITVDPRTATLMMTEQGRTVLYSGKKVVLPDTYVRRMVRRAAFGEGLPASRVDAWRRVSQIRADFAKLRSVKPQAVISDAMLAGIVAGKSPPSHLDADLSRRLVEAADAELPVAPSLSFDTGLF